MSKLPLPNRLALYCGIAAALLAGLAPLIMDADWETTAGIIAGLGSITALLFKFLTGWQEYAKAELYDRGEDTAAEWEVDPEPPIDGFDENEAEDIPDELVEAAQHDPGDPGTTLATPEQRDVRLPPERRPQNRKPPG